MSTAGFIGHSWRKILVFKDDMKSFETFELNEEQKLKIPLRTMKKNKRKDSSIEVKKKMDQYGLNPKSQRTNFEFNSQVIFSKPGIKQQIDETPKTLDLIDQVFDKFAFDDIFDIMCYNGGNNDF